MIRRSFAAAFLGVCLAAVAINACAADLRKVVRYAMKSAESKLDPQSESDEASGSINESIFDSLLQYDYLARPAKLRPRTAATLPEVNADGTVYVLKVKPGILFTPDPAFQGKPRELTAADYVYSLRRLMDPKLKSQWLFLVEGKIKGADVVMADARKTNRYDYDRPIEGLRALDRYTLRIELNNSDFGFANVLALQATSAVSREVADFYGDDIAAHPVGTGPYLVKSWTRGSKLVLEANPGYREEFFEGDPGEDARSREIHARLKGQRIPIAGRIEIYVIDEDQPRWLAFLNTEHDLVDELPYDLANLVIPNGQLAPNLQRRAIQMDRAPRANVDMALFNMEHPLVGGYTPEKVALRRAISLAYAADDEIRLVRKGQSIPSQSPVAPLTAGYDPTFRSEMSEFSPARAKALLDAFGFIDRNGDGWREQPDGSPLKLEMATQPDQLSRQLDEIWKRSMTAVGLQIDFRPAKWPENLKNSRAGKLMMWRVGWVAAQPDGDTFLALGYGPNKGQANHARFDLPAFNRIYARQRTIADGAERDALFHEAKKLFAAYAPYKFVGHRIETAVYHPWVVGFRRHPFMRDFWKYVDIDPERKSSSA